MTAFAVADIMEIIGQQYGLNVLCENIDDQAFGVVIQQDSPIVQFYSGHKDLYNYQILDGDPIVLKRTPVGSDLSIDLDITESECILRSPTNPRITYTRVDPMSLPREVEVQYIDPDRLYATNTQSATHHGAKIWQGKLTVTCAFVLANDQARKLGYDLLYRLWARSLSLAFEHPNPNIEAGDVLQVSGTRGTFTVLVQEQLLTKERTSQIKATALLTEKASTVAIAAGYSSGTVSTGSLASSPDDDAWLVVM